MKKILLSLILGLTAVAGMAQTSKTYNEKLVVTVNSISTDSIAVPIQITKNENGSCDFLLKNFCLISKEEGSEEADTLGVGTIELKGVAMQEEGGITNIQTNQTIAIVPGDDPRISSWLADKEEGQEEGMLDNVPIVLKGKLSETDLYVNIDIDMTDAIGQLINVVVGQEKKITTSIQGVKNDYKNKNAIYTLSGMQVTEAVKGVYIINGKKVIK